MQHRGLLKIFVGDHIKAMVRGLPISRSVKQRQKDALPITIQLREFQSSCLQPTNRDLRATMIGDDR